jgi:hypothetical protein
LCDAKALILIISKKLGQFAATGHDSLPFEALTPGAEKGYSRTLAAHAEVQAAGQ